MDAIPPPSLPHDLLRPICEHLEDDKQSLCTISLCSAACRQEAQRVLFRDVTDPQTEGLAFLCAIVQSPDRLALLVRAFIMPSGLLYPPEKVWPLIRFGMKSMTNLKYLCAIIDVRMYKEMGSAAWILDGCTFQLERFTCASTYRDVEEILRIFMPQQPKLKHLRIEPIGGEIRGYREQTVPSICSQLSSLHGEWAAIYPIVRGSKVKTLDISGSVSPGIARDSEIISVAPALQCIETLSVEDPELEHMERILQHCTSLKVLELWHWSGFEDEVFDILPELPSLHTLIISEYNELDEQIESPDELVWSIFDNPSGDLERVDFRVEKNMYIRYSRSQIFTAAQTKVSKWEVRSPWLLE